MSDLLKHPETVERLIGKRVLILGDIVADQFLNGTIARVSREAPVFILRHDETQTLPGGAANTAANVAAIGGIPLLVGVVGNDRNGELLLEAIAGCGIRTGSIVTADGATTTTKVRVLAGQHYAARQQVIRIDYEETRAADAMDAELISAFNSVIDSADAIVISDYGYGVANASRYPTALSAARLRDIPIIVDSRFRLSEFHGATSATPNREEAAALIGGEVTDKACGDLRERLGLDSLLVTAGDQGMHLYRRDTEPLHLAAVGPTEPVDVTGAGDTVIAVYSLALAAGIDPADAAFAANHAGGLVVMKKGTATISSEELAASIAFDQRELCQ